jgi:aryl-alcohol dehydrogenase-like predicted oxidoreductase
MAGKFEKLALGTAQFGLEYGVSNLRGKVSMAEVSRILNLAESLGINSIDTASAYGNSEDVLGALMNSRKLFSLFTKLRALPDNVMDVDEWVSAEINGSLQRLRRSKIDAVLLHEPKQLLGSNGEQIHRTLNAMRDKGLFKKIGISVYRPVELELILQKYSFDIVQLPFNALDQRFLKNDLLKRVKDMGMIVHSRSVFLQGLLLMQSFERPKKFLIWKKHWDRWDAHLEETGKTALQTALNHALSCSEIDRVIIGVESELQLSQIANAALPTMNNVLKQFSIDDERLLIPSYWENL